MQILSNALHAPRPLRRARRMTPWPALALLVFAVSFLWGLIWAALLALTGWL